MGAYPMHNVQLDDASITAELREGSLSDSQLVLVDSHNDSRADAGCYDHRFLASRKSQFGKDDPT